MSAEKALQRFVLETSRFPILAVLYKLLYKLCRFLLVRTLSFYPSVVSVYTRGGSSEDMGQVGLSDIDVYAITKDRGELHLDWHRRASAVCPVMKDFHSLDVRRAVLHSRMRSREGSRRHSSFRLAYGSALFPQLNSWTSQPEHSLTLSVQSYQKLWRRSRLLGSARPGWARHPVRELERAVAYLKPVLLDHELAMGEHLEAELSSLRTKRWAEGGVPDRFLQCWMDYLTLFDGVTDRFLTNPSAPIDSSRETSKDDLNPPNMDPSSQSGWISQVETQSRFWFYDLEMVAWTPALVIPAPAALLPLKVNFEQQLQEFADSWDSKTLPPMFMTHRMVRFGPRVTQRSGWPTEGQRRLRLDDPWLCLHHRLLGEPIGVNLWQQLHFGFHRRNSAQVAWNARKILTLLPWRRLQLEHRMTFTSYHQAWLCYFQVYREEPLSALLQEFVSGPCKKRNCQRTLAAWVETHLEEIGRFHHYLESLIFSRVHQEFERLSSRFQTETGP